MRDPKAIRKAIMTAKSLASLVDPKFARVPLPDLGVSAPEAYVPEHSPAMHQAFGLPMPRGYAGGGDVYGDNSKIKVVGSHEGEHRLVPISPKNTNYRHVMEYVPIKWLLQHRGNDYRHSEEKMEQLRNEIEAEGLREPVLISVGKNRRTAVTGEGNHRVLAAHQLGYTHIPARAAVGDAYHERFPEGAHDEDIIPQPNKYFPSEAKPSRVIRSLGYEGQEELPEHWWEQGYAAGGEIESLNLATGGFADDENPYTQPNDLGFYSHAAATAAELPQERGTPEQFRGMLLNKGVKPAELEWSGFDPAFADQPQVTRQQIAEHFHANRPAIREKILKNGPSEAERNELRRKHIRSLSDYQQRARENPDFDPGGEMWKQMAITHQGEKEALQSKYEKPRHEDYTIPGGEHYREILLKHGDDGKFGGVRGHFGGEPDVLASLRMKDRRDLEGDSVLHLDELQSDWGQEAKKSGVYHPKEHQNYLRDLEQRAAPLVAEEFGIPEETARAKMTEWTRTGYLRHHHLADMLGERDEFADRSMEDIDRSVTGVGNAPYIGKTEGWLELGLKRALLEAAREGHDKLAWTPGNMQADRYSGGSEEEEAKRRAGMIQFYDKMLPKALLKLAQQHDPEAEFTYSEIEHPSYHEYDNGDREEGSDAYSGPTQLPALRITPKMRESILKKGFPAYAAGGEVESYADGGEIDPELFKQYMKRIHTPFSDDPESVRKALSIASSYRAPIGMETGVGSLYNIKQSLPAKDVRATIEDIPGITMKKPVKKSWEDFYQKGKGGVFINMGGDLSNFGRLTHINDKELAWPVDLHAGTKFMLEPNPKYVWGNAAGHSTAFENKIRAAERQGKDVYGIFSPMGPSAVNSSHNMFDALMAQIPNAGIDKKHLREFDTALKRGEHLDASIKNNPKKLKAHLDALKAWPGLENAKEASEFARPEAGNLTGTHRTMIVKFMDKADWLKKGFPEVGVTRAAITDPELKGVGGNKIGHRIVKLSSEELPGAKRAFEHSTYPTYTGGEYEMDVPLVQRHYATPDVIEEMVKKPTKAGQIVHPYSEDTLGRATARKLFEEQKQTQPINQRFLDSVMLGMENQQKYGFKKGGSVRKALMIAKTAKKK